MIMNGSVSRPSDLTTIERVRYEGCFPCFVVSNWLYHDSPFFGFSHSQTYRTAGQRADPKKSFESEMELFADDLQTPKNNR